MSLELGRYEPSLVPPRGYCKNEMLGTTMLFIRRMGESFRGKSNHGWINISADDWVRSSFPYGVRTTQKLIKILAHRNLVLYLENPDGTIDWIKSKEVRE